MTNRFLSILLAACMIISILPAAALAANVENFKDVDPNDDPGTGTGGSGNC